MSAEVVRPNQVLLEDANEPERVLHERLAGVQRAEHLECRHSGQHPPHEHLLLEAVHEAEGGDALEVAVGGEHAGGEGVECADPGFVVRHVVQRVDAALEVLGRVVGESQEQDLARPQATLVEELQVHGDDRGRLAGSRTSHHPNGALGHERERVPLFRVEVEMPCEGNRHHPIVDGMNVRLPVQRRPRPDVGVRAADISDARRLAPSHPLQSRGLDPAGRPLPKAQLRT